MEASTLPLSYSLSWLVPKAGVPTLQNKEEKGEKKLQVGNLLLSDNEVLLLFYLKRVSVLCFVWSSSCSHYRWFIGLVSEGSGFDSSILF